MTELVRLDARASARQILSAIERDGAVVVENVLSPADVDRTLDEVQPYVEATKPGADAFSGFKTTRTGALVARSPACRELVTHKTILKAARKFLQPYSKRIQLHLTQVIRIRPGQKAQPLHRDRWAWGTHLSHVEPQFNTIWALTDFTAENGATQVTPGSVAWPDNRQPTKAEIVQAEMPRGSVFVYTGSVFHGGGHNRSHEDRIGINLTYTLGWLRQEENQYLSCPPEIARDLDPELQELIGYSMGSYALGYYTPPLPPGAGPEVVGPEVALGRGSGGGQFGSAELLAGLQSDIEGSKPDA
ncbi:MAG: phytanoyl-CoA dioxygenase family protein [Proteobacteria bacterium]|nr:phytanoyl-CoA dioxygenase family protein [Pseudomonadota bacterium]